MKRLALTKSESDILVIFPFKELEPCLHPCWTINVVSTIFWCFCCLQGYRHWNWLDSYKYRSVYLALVWFCGRCARNAHDCTRPVYNVPHAWNVLTAKVTQQRPQPHFVCFHVCSQCCRQLLHVFFCKSNICVSKRVSIKHTLVLLQSVQSPLVW